MDGADAAVARRAIRQHGLVTRTDASAAGMTRSQVRHRVATGRWSVVGAGWTVLRFTWRDYTQRAAGLVAEVRGALAAAA